MSRLGTSAMDRRPRRAAVALGSNVGDRVSHIAHAVDRLRTLLSDVVVSAFIDAVLQYLIVCLVAGPKVLKKIDSFLDRLHRKKSEFVFFGHFGTTCQC